MKIYVEQVPEGGLELRERYEPVALELDRADIRFAVPINISAQITKEANVLSVDLEIEAVMLLTCNRCLAEFTLPLSKRVQLRLPIENREILDLTDNLREELILNYPLKPLCRLKCRGLCPTCGQNLNQGPCKCIRKGGGPLS